MTFFAVSVSDACWYANDSGICISNYIDVSHYRRRRCISSKLDFRVCSIMYTQALP